MEKTFTVTKVNEYKHSSRLFVQTDSKECACNRFFIPKSPIWVVGNRITKSIEEVSKTEEAPDTFYTKSGGRIFKISYRIA